ncbi:MAG: hypothetical protein ACHQ4H_13600 [Ktedonobacterales bacterium]
MGESRRGTTVYGQSLAVPRYRQGRRFLVGLGIGLIPAALGILNGFLSCPAALLTDGYMCADSHQQLAGWLFVIGLGLDVLDLLVALVFLFFRSVRFIGLGLLLMTLAGPFIGLAGYELIAIAQHPFH